MTDRKPSWHFHLIWVSAFLVVAILACLYFRSESDTGPEVSAAESSGTVPLPAISWSNGDPRDTDNEYAAIYFEYIARKMAAHNARNFSDARLLRVVTSDLLESSVEYSAMGVSVYAGPLPSVVLSVDEEPDSSGAKVTVCVLASINWNMTYLKSTEPTFIDYGGRVFSYTMERDDSNIARIVHIQRSSYNSSGNCSLENASLGYYQPTPTVDPNAPRQAIGPDGSVIVYSS